MLFSKIGAVSRKSRTSDRVASWVYQKDISCKLVAGVSNKLSFDWAPSLNTYSLFTRDTTIQQHDKIVIDNEAYIVSAEARYEWVGTSYRVYIVTLSNESIS